MMMTTTAKNNCLDQVLPLEIADNVLSFVFRPTTKKELRDAVLERKQNKKKSEQKYGPISDWDTSDITDMSFLFVGYPLFNGDISSWNVSNVKSFKAMFQDCVIFNKDISSWDVRNGEDFSYMFNRANKFNRNITTWEIRNAKDMNYMFAYSNFKYDTTPWEEFVNPVDVPMKNIFLMAGLDCR